MNGFSGTNRASIRSSSSSCLFLFLVNYCMLPRLCSAAQITISNNCSFIVWPLVSGTLSPNITTPLRTGELQVFPATPPWSGRVWGRTNCTGLRGRFTCTNNGCNYGTLYGRNCIGATVVEFNISGGRNLDLYGINLANGFNLPVLVVPQGNNCPNTACPASLNTTCPSRRQLKTDDGKVVGCFGACEPFDPMVACPASDYSRAFKRACPNASTNPTEDQDSTFTCNTGADYIIIFCPSSHTTTLITGKPHLPPSPTSSQGTRSSTKGYIRIILIATSTAASLILVLVLLIIAQKIKQGARKKKLHELLTLDGHTETRSYKRRGTQNHNLRLFTYESILSATSNFSLDNKLGEGGFGTVYKGQTLDGHDIAVKVLSQESAQGLLEFKTELILISKLQHVNLVKLHGLCIHGEDKMIVYDYMPNKSLDFFLFSSSMEEKLNWQQRVNIIDGIAQGLLYLHKYSRLKIIHRDLKPSNILLDENMNAKISDFGLARVFDHNIDEDNTNRRVGTFGYMAPEYAMQGMFSIKSDVYSFGVLVLEIVSGRKNNCFHQIEGPLNLVEQAWELWRNDSTLQLMDSSLTDSCNLKQFQRCVHIALLCVENRVVDRPTIEDVILMLKSEMTSLARPKNPSFIARNHVVEEVMENMGSKSSMNEITVFDIGGR